MKVHVEMCTRTCSVRVRDTPHAARTAWRTGAVENTLTGPSTESVADWQVMGTPRNAAPPNEGEERPGKFDEYLNWHCIWQLLWWGANVDSPRLVHNRIAHGHTINYSIKDEGRSR